MNRRSLLRRLGAGSLLGVAGCGDGPGPPRDRTPRVETARTPPTDPTTTADAGSAGRDRIAAPWEFDDVVDLGDVGADGTGTRALDPLLHEHAEDGVLLSLPPGRYRLEEEFDLLEFSRFGLVGDGATLVPPEGNDSVMLGLGEPGAARRLYVAGLTFDFTAEGTGGRPLLARVDDGLVVRDLTVRGRQDVDIDGFRFDIAESDGAGRVERVRMPDGATADYQCTGMEVGDDTRGDLEFVDCHVAGFPDNGLYADPPAGRVRVIGGTYVNNGVAGVRVNAARGSLIRGVHVRTDAAPRGFKNMRGIRLRGGDGLRVEGCLVDLRRVTGSDGALTVAPEVGSATVRNTTLRVDADGVAGVRIKGADHLVDAGRGPYRFENVVVDGDADGGAAVLAADRDACVFDGLYVSGTGRNRDGVAADGVSGALTDSVLSVSGDPLRLAESDIRVEDLTVVPHRAGPCWSLGCL